MFDEGVVGRCVVLPYATRSGRLTVAAVPVAKRSKRRGGRSVATMRDT